MNADARHLPLPELARRLRVDLFALDTDTETAASAPGDGDRLWIAGPVPGDSEAASDHQGITVRLDLARVIDDARDDQYPRGTA